MNEHLTGSGTWVCAKTALERATEQLSRLKSDAKTETEKRVSDAYHDWRHSGLVYFFTRRPRPEFGAGETGVFFAPPMERWFNSLPGNPSLTWDSPNRYELTVGIGQRGYDLKRLVQALERVPDSQRRVFLSLNDINLIGVSLE